jgi:hypothetical protein
MCGKSIFGVLEDDKKYSTLAYCSKECEDAGNTNFVGHFVVVLAVIWSGILALIYRGTLPSFAFPAVFIFLVLDILLAAEYVRRWNLRERILRNKPITQRE